MSVLVRASLALVIAALPALSEAQQGQSSSDGYYKGSGYNRASNQMRRAAEPAAPPPAPAAPAEKPDEMKSATEAALSQIRGGDAPPPAGDRRLKSLSEDVVQSIVDFDGREDSAAALRGQLQSLVGEARASGRDDAYVSALIDEASAARMTEIPAALKTPQNRLDTATLLQGLDGEPAGAGAAPTRFDFVTVQPGETLSIIAARVYDNALLYGRLYEANRDVLPSPDRIKVGQRLRVPR